MSYPILLVLGGLAIGFIPGLPRVQPPPDVIFLLFVPPLVYVGAFLMPWRDFRNNLRPIGLLAIGLVLTTVFVVATVAHEAIDGMSWAVAFVLATIVAPPDAVAVTAVTERLRVPRRIITVLEGESLVNDVTALVAYRMAVTAVLTGTFSVAEASIHFVWTAVAGIAIGVVVGWLSVAVRRWLDDPPVETTVSLLIPFAAYLPAEAMGASGVLAVVTAGLYVGRRSPEAFPADSRVLARSFWSVLEFLLNGLAFILVGLQLRAIYEDLGDYPLTKLLGYTALISITVIVLRIVWVFAATYLPWLLSPSQRQRDPPPWRNVAVVAWAGLRGVDSLATSLALPLAIGTGAAFPQRPLVIFLAFGVIVATLVLQGLTLPLLVRRLGVREGGENEREEAVARRATAQAALERLQHLAPERRPPPEAVERLKERYETRLACFQASPDSATADRCDDEIVLARNFRLELLGAERQALIDLRNGDVIGDETLRRIERELDLEELRLRAGEEPP